MKTMCQKNAVDSASNGQLKISLRHLMKSDKNNVCNWLISPYVLQHSFVVPGPNRVPQDFASRGYAERYYEHLMNSFNRATYAIMVGEQHIGNVGLKGIDRSSGSADCFIEIGEEGARGKGYGYEAMILVLNEGFLNQELKRVYLDVLEFNLSAIKLYSKLGFTTSGLKRWHYDEFGQYWQVLRMMINSCQWQAVSKSG